MFLFFNAFNDICKEIIGQMDFSLLRDHLILCPRISAVSRFFVFLCFVFFNAFNEICKETIGQMDFALLQDRLILDPPNTRSHAFGDLLLRRGKKKQKKKRKKKRERTKNGEKSLIEK